MRFSATSRWPSEARLALLLLLFVAPAWGSAQTEVDKQIDKIGGLFRLIDDYYVDTVDHNALGEAVIVKALRELDPHSVYISAEDVNRANEGLRGNFEGVGIQFNILRDTILVVATIEGGPSEKVGLLASDRIVTVDGETVAGIGIDNRGVAERLRGPKGTEVVVEVARRGEEGLLEFLITRDKIPLNSLQASYMIDETTGYVKITRFAAKTLLEFRQAVDYLTARGMETLILDLQGNSGGYLNTAFQLADEFLVADRLIVYTEGVNSPRNEFRSTRNGTFEEQNLIILIDQFSASASEIVSGAVQDWDRGLLVGRRTFGKGLVQKPFTLSDGSQVRLTVANYYTPSGRFIQKPYEDGSSGYRKELTERLRRGELTDSLKAQYEDSLAYTTEGGRTVYGGGGIMPDVFVPLDTTWNDDFASKVRRKGLINKFVLDYLDRYRDQLEEFYPTAEDLREDFLVDGAFWDEFDTYVHEKLPDLEEAPTERSGEVLGIQLKALLARNLYGSTGFYIIQNELNDALHAALDELREGDIDKRQIQWRE